MQIIPVIDVLDGQVVHGRAGQRKTYQPIQSRLLKSTAPREVLAALFEIVPSNTAYVADLNGLINGDVQTNVLNQLANQKTNLLIDAGIRSPADVDRLPTGDHVQLVLASETIPSVQVLQEIVQRYPKRQFVFSFDLIDGAIKSVIPEWKQMPITKLARSIWDLGLANWIVLDIKSVGMATGPTTVEMCQQLKSKFSDCQIITGGGVRNRSNLQILKQIGVSSVLLATALHDGSITPADCVSVL